MKSFSPQRVLVNFLSMCDSGDPKTNEDQEQEEREERWREEKGNRMISPLKYRVTSSAFCIQ